MKYNKERKGYYTLTQNAHPAASRLLQPVPGLPSYRYASLDSTNLWARAMLADEKPPFVVTADQQTAGRGTRGRSFYSPEGSGLYATYCFSIPPKRLAQVTPRAAVAAAEAIAGFGRTPSIKWVNDILLHGHKVGGILTESLIQGEQVVVLCGIGLNVYPGEAVPHELRGIYGSIWEDREEAHLQTLFVRLTQNMIHYIDQGAEFIDRYRRYSCVIGQALSYLQDGVWKRARGIGLDEDGRLLVETPGGIQRLHTEEIRLENQGGSSY